MWRESQNKDGEGSGGYPFSTTERDRSDVDIWGLRPAVRFVQAQTPDVSPASFVLSNAT